MKHNYGITEASAIINENLMTVEWASPSFGFGQILLKWDNKRNKLIIDAEELGRNLVKQAFSQLIDNAQLDSDIATYCHSAEIDIETVRELVFPVIDTDKMRALVMPFYHNITPYSFSNVQNDYGVELRYDIGADRTVQIYYDLHLSSKSPSLNEFLGTVWSTPGECSQNFPEFTFTRALLNTWT